jgi:hypothetical protein
LIDDQRALGRNRLLHGCAARLPMTT